MNYRRKNRANKMFIILLLLLITISCSNNDKNNSNNNNRIKDRLEHLRSFDFEFYEKLDTFSLKGINVIDTLNIKYPFYAIRRRYDSTFVDIHCLTSPTHISYRSYKKVNDYYISTEFIKDEELRDVFSRKTTIIYPDRIILYFYHITENFEQLLDISFQYKNGVKKLYCNRDNCYYNICDTLNEENIKTLFPTMQINIRSTE